MLYHPDRSWILEVPPKLELPILEAFTASLLLGLTILMTEATKGDSETKVKLPENDSQLKHIFRNEEGHLPDTPTNRNKILNVANNPDNKLGKDARGNDWYARIENDGSQTWVRVRNGKVDNAGVNMIPRTWDSETGLYNNSKK